MAEINISGYCDPKFAKVEENGWEFEGASFAAYHKGKCVVDLHGGYADKSSLAKWTDKTKTVVFSTTKAVGALCVAVLVDRGYIKYEQKIASFWPEFAQNGKEDITVLHVVNHQAGLPMFSEPITLEDCKNSEKISQIIEKQTPYWKPGTKSGYHAITYGWLVDQIIRRADPKKRSIGQFFKEEIGDKHGIELFIGLPLSEEYTVARLTQPSFSYFLREVWHQPSILFLIFSMVLNFSLGKGFPQALGYCDWLRPAKYITCNNPEVHFIEQTAALGITNAKNLAKLFSLVLKGNIISKDLIENFYEPLINENDAILSFILAKGHGFMYEPHPKKPGKWLFGHPGFGGNNVMIDPEEELIMAYVTNGIKNGNGEKTMTYRMLRDAVFDSLDKFPEGDFSKGTEGLGEAAAAMLD